MLTPTGVTYAQYWNAIKAGNPTHARFTFLGQNIVLDDSDIDIDSGVIVTDMFNGDTDLVFGRTLSKQVTVTFINSSKLDPLQWTGEFTLEFGVEIGNPATTNWVTIGIFSGEKPNNVTSAQTINFTAYDRMTRFNLLADDFVKTLSYPKTVKQIYDAVCSYVGVQNVAGNELANIMSRSFSSAPAEMIGYTCRDILAWVAEACGCYAKINSAGKVKMVWFTDNTSHAVTGAEEFSVESGDVNNGLTWNEADTYTWNDFDNFIWDDVCGYQEAYKVSKLYVKQLGSDVDILYPSSYGDNYYTIVDNPFLFVSTSSDITSYIAPIFNRLSNFGGYLPVQLDCVGNWCVEAGDIITIDVNNFTISFPIFVKEMRWNSAINDTYETTGSKNRKIYNSSANKQVALTSNKIEMYVTEAEYDMRNYTDGEVAGAKDYTDGEVAGAKNYTDGEVADALNTVDQNYYKIRSGIAIDVAGVTISGSKYIKMQSGTSIDVETGGKIDIKNGADLDIESGGDVNIKSGGNVKLESGGGLEIKTGASFSTQSGNLSVDSSGSPTIKGTAEIPSGKTLSIKSGGSGEIQSGGNFNIKSGGHTTIESGGDLIVKNSSNNTAVKLLNTGIDIESGADVNVKSGADVNVKSGGNVKVESGGSMDIRTGGTFTIQTGNFDVDSSGNVTTKGNSEIPSGKKLTVKSGGDAEIQSGGDLIVKSGGNAEIQSGGTLQVKSGGNFNIASGGNVDIHAAGTLEITGGTGSILMDTNGVTTTGGKYVKLQSGNSYMMLSATSLVFNGGNGSMSTDDGRVFSINGFNFTRSKSGNYYSYMLTGSEYNAPSTNLIYIGADINGTWFKTQGTFVFNPSGQSSYGLRIKKSDNYVVLYGDNGIMLGKHSDSTIGDINYIYGDYIYYNHLNQNSSKDIKHDINPLESVGEKLDRLKPVTFIYDDDKKEQKRMGLIYEDAIETMPEICTNDESEKAINYVELIPALLKEIQELRIRVKALEEREVN